MNRTARTRSAWPTVAGLTLVVVGPPLLAWVPARVLPGGSLSTQVLLQAIYCMLPVAILMLIRYGERLPLTSVGLRRPTRATVVLGIVIAALPLLVLPLLTDPLVKRWAQPGADAGVAALAILPVWFRIVVAVTGGATEELLYRGYAIERLAALTANRSLGAALALLVFTAAHIPAWGFAFAVVADLPAGIVLTLLYLWRRDLVANMIGHATALTVAMFTIVPLPH